MSRSIVFYLLVGFMWAVSAVVNYFEDGLITVWPSLIAAFIFFLWALYLWLHRSEKGRAFLKKLHLYRNRKEEKDK